MGTSQKYTLSVSTQTYRGRNCQCALQVMLMKSVWYPQLLPFWNQWKYHKAQPNDLLSLLENSPCWGLCLSVRNGFEPQRQNPPSISKLNAIWLPKVSSSSEVCFKQRSKLFGSNKTHCFKIIFSRSLPGSQPSCNRNPSLGSFLFVWGKFKWGKPYNFFRYI